MFYELFKFRCRCGLSGVPYVTLSSSVRPFSRDFGGPGRGDEEWSSLEQLPVTKAPGRRVPVRVGEFVDEEPLLHDQRPLVDSFRVPPQTGSPIPLDRVPVLLGPVIRPTHPKLLLPHPDSPEAVISQSFVLPFTRRRRCCCPLGL